MADIPVEERFSALCRIVRAQHFAWREAVGKACPELDLGDIVSAMWEVTGHQTARAYLRRIDPKGSLPTQIAQCFAWSSQVMGEDASAEIPEERFGGGDDLESPGADEAFVRHTGCPWFHWHERLGLLAEDRPGCDTWFRTVVEDINTALGANVRVETLQALPDGDRCCLRRLWVDQQSEPAS